MAQKIYITVIARGKSSYLINARSPRDKVLTISPGMVESGDIQGGEIKSHQMDFQFTKDDEHNFNVRLHLISGDADLYMKVCQPDKKCELTKTELTQAPDMNLKKSVEKAGIKSVSLPVVCSSLPSPVVPDKFSVSKNCIFGIYIVGKNKDGKGKVHYELSVEDTIGSHLLIKDHFLRVK